MGVLHHHFVLQHLQNKYRAAKNKGGKAMPLYVCFVDFEKAFDKVDFEKAFDKVPQLS